MTPFEAECEYLIQRAESKNQPELARQLRSHRDSVMDKLTTATPPPKL